MNKKSDFKKELISYTDAFETLADGLVSTDGKKFEGSFHSFLTDVWAYSFDHPEYFNAWHIGVLAEDIERCLEEDKNYVAVLPRFHFKSTILGHAFSVWRLLQSKRDMSVLYLSFSDGMARYHLSEINKSVQRNPILTSMMVNRSPKADFSFRYYINKNPMEIMHGGLFSFKRGMHVNGALIADDVLRDPENPLNMGQITKVEDHFMTESMFIPLKGVPVIVLGTPMMPGDLLSKLQEDERFIARTLPALDPEPKRRVLMPELYSEEWLLNQQKARPKSFASEFLLQPHFSTESYFEEDQITACEDEKLVNLSYNKTYLKSMDEQIFGGFDVGKKRHPSHLVLFSRIGDQVKQIHSSFLDGWNYTDQVEYLNEVAENYQLDGGYVDNTRGELEDRGLHKLWRSMSFTRKSKNTMAQVFETFIVSGNLKLIKDERQKQQIISVNNELKAPETPMGHGDAFFSIAMALQAIHETEEYKYEAVGGLGDWLDAISPDESPKPKEHPVLKKLKFEGDTKTTISIDGVQERDMESLNPNCREQFCVPEFWVLENKLCLYCNYRG